jgi:hypothetical protein
MLRYLLVIVIAIVFTCLIFTTDVTATTPSPSPSPSVSPSSTTPRLVGPVWKEWCLSWHRRAIRQRVLLAKAKWCFSLDSPVPVPHGPRNQVWSDWVNFGVRCKYLAHRFHERFLTLRYRMAHPTPLVSYTQWKPLVLWYFGDEWSTALRILRAESGGRPWASNGQYKGLFQMGSHWYSGYWHFSPYNAEANTKYAHLLRHLCGWSSWTTY